MNRKPLSPGIEGSCEDRATPNTREISKETSNTAEDQSQQWQSNSSAASVLALPSVFSLKDTYFGFGKGIEGTGVTSLLETILFSLFNQNSELCVPFLWKEGTETEEDPELDVTRKMLFRIIKSLRSYPYWSPQLDTKYFINSLDEGLENFLKLSEDAEELISGLMKILGHDEKRFNSFSDSTYSFVYTICLGDYDNQSPGILLQELPRLLSYQKNRPRFEIGAPLFFVHTNRGRKNGTFNSKLNIVPSLTLNHKRSETLKLAAVICAPDSINYQSHMAFVRFRNKNKIQWMYFNSEGQMSTSSKGLVSEVRDCSYLEEILSNYELTPPERRMDRDDKMLSYILQYGILYFYFKPNEPRTLDYKDNKHSESSPGNGHLFVPDESLSCKSSKTTHTHYGDSIAGTSTLAVREDFGQSSSTPTRSLNLSRDQDSSSDSDEPLNNTYTEMKHELFLPWNSLSTGRLMGIKQKANSCYVDATLFCFFYSSKFFDSLIDGGNENTANSNSDLMSAVLRKIVELLRGHHFVPWEEIELFREILWHLSPNLNPTKMADVDEFIRVLMGKALNVPKFILYTVGSGNYLHQIVLKNTKGKSTKSTFKDLQTLFDESMETQELKFKTLPSPALIIKMARSDGELIRDRGVLPNLTLDISTFLANRGRMDTKFHLHSVIVLNRKHYTAFVRCGLDVKSPWVYFDSLGPMISEHRSIGEELELGLDDFSYHRSSSTVLQMCTDNHVCIYVQKPLGRM